MSCDPPKGTRAPIEKSMRSTSSVASNSASSARGRRNSARSSAPSDGLPNRRRQCEHRQQDRDERRPHLDPKPCGRELVAQFVDAVPPRVPGARVLLAPQEHVLRHGNDRMSAALERAKDARDRVLVVRDVLEDVERADDVELLVEGDVGRVHLKRASRADSAFVRGRAGDSDFAAGKRKTRKPLADAMEDESCSATDLAKRLRTAAILRHCGRDHLVATAKPEVPLFERGERAVVVVRETARACTRELRCERHIAIDNGGRKRTARTAPIAAVEAIAAARTDLHPWLARVIPAMINARPAIFGNVIGSPNSRPPARTTNTNVSATNG
jgi:hypothetical protein